MRTKRFLQFAVACLIASAALPAEVAGASSSGSSSAAIATPLLTCSTPLRLYDGTYLTGSNVPISARGIWLNLSNYGFNNMTSSYKVGACAVVLASGTDGSGSLYPYCLSANCEEDVMASGWNNVISSVYVR
jgi:hypothetical protein